MKSSFINVNKNFHLIYILFNFVNNAEIYQNLKIFLCKFQNK